MTPPTTNNLPTHTRDAAVAAGRRAAREGYDAMKCPWIKDWVFTHDPVSLDDPRPQEIMDLWDWAHTTEKERHHG